MFAKLKKKIEEEQQIADQSSPGLSPITKSSSSSLSNLSGSESASPAKTSSTRSSRHESPSSRKNSETSIPIPHCTPNRTTPNGANSMAPEKSSQTSDSNSKVLQQKTDHIQMLETKVKDLNQQVSVEHKRCLLLQVELQQSSQAHERKEKELLTRIDYLYKAKSESDQRLQECRTKVDRLIEQQDSKEELEGFQAQELAKVKHLLLASQQDLQAKETALKSQCQETNTVREQVRHFEGEIQRLKEELYQSQHQLTLHTSLQEEVDRLKQEALKSSSVLEEKDTTLAHLQDKLSVLENRLKDNNLGGDERLQALVTERHTLEKKVEESYQHLSEVKTTWSEKIHSLETQIFHLNKKMAEDSEECNTLEAQVEMLRQKTKKLEEENWSLAEQLQDAQKLAEKAKSAKSEVENDLKQKLERAESECLSRTTQLEQQLTTTNKEHSKEKQEMQQRINELVSSQTEQVENSIEAERQLTQLEDDNKRLKTDLSKKEKELLLLQQDSMSTKEKLLAANAKLERLDSECSQSAIDIQERSKQLQQKEQHLQTVAQERDRLMLRNAELSQQLELVRRELEEETLSKEKDSQDTKQRVDKLQKEIEAANQRISELEKQALDQDNSSHRLSEQKTQISRLEDELADKNKTIKLQQQRLNDMKKTFKRELRAQAQPNSEMSGGEESLMNHHIVEPKNLEDINFRYLRHVVFKFMTSPEYEAQHLIRAVSVLLQFSKEEEKFIREMLEWKTSWFGSKPQPSNDSRPPPVFAFQR